MIFYVSRENGILQLSLVQVRFIWRRKICFEWEMRRSG